MKHSLHHKNTHRIAKENNMGRKSRRQKEHEELNKLIRKQMFGISNPSGEDLSEEEQMKFDGIMVKSQKKDWIKRTHMMNKSNDNANYN